MMYKNKKGFSLAELLISLLIISIILAAAIPTVTKRNKYDPERTWQWSGQNNSAYFGVGSDQSAVIGYFKVPQYSERTAYYDEKVFKLTDLPPAHPLRDGDDEDNPAFTTTGDKLNLVKRFPFSDNVEYNLRNSHISFYNIRGKNATENDVKYAGRIAADEYNIAFGIGTLASLRAIDYSEIIGASDATYAGAFKGYNTSIGHYSSLLTSGGQYNTAVGFSALKNNFMGNNNTAVGMEALSNANQGAGNYNTAVGSYALKIAGDGHYNTAIGSGACNNLTGNGNICIGYGAGAYADGDVKNVNYSLAIGYGEGAYGNTKGNGVPLVTGTLDQADETLGETNPPFPATTTAEEERHKQLSVNALKFKVKPFDGSVPIFEVIARSGENGYSSKANENAKLGDFNFTFRDTINPNSTGQNQSIQMQAYGLIQNPYDRNLTGDIDKQVRVNIVNHRSNLSKTSANFTYGDLLLNESFMFISPKTANGTTKKDYAHINVYNEKDTVGDKTFLALAHETILLQPKGYSNVAMEMTKTNGFKVSSQKAAGAKSSYIQLTDDGSNSGLQLSSNASYFTMNKDGVSLLSGDTLPVSIKGNANSSLDFGKVYVATDDIFIESLASVAIASDSSLVKTISAIPAYVENKARSVAQSVHSDIRLKNVSGDSTAGLKEINALEVKNYTYKNDKEKTPHVGVIAQQLQKIFPNSVFEGEDGYLRIKTEEIFYAMVNSIKELFAQIQDLTAKVVGLDKRLTELEKENAMLKKQNADFEKRLSKLEAKMAK